MTLAQLYNMAAARTRVSRREMARAATTNLLPFVRPYNDRIYAKNCEVPI